jgi:hypothetical protein
VNSFMFVNRFFWVVFLASLFHCIIFTALLFSPRFTVISFALVNTGVAFLASPISIIPSSLTYSRTRFIQVLRFIFAACITVTFLVSFPTFLYFLRLLPSIRRTSLLAANLVLAAWFTQATSDIFVNCVPGISFLAPPFSIASAFLLYLLDYPFHPSA